MVERIDLVPGEKILDQIEGATIVSVHVEDEEGMHLCFQDGRVLIVSGVFILALQKRGERLH